MRERERRGSASYAMRNTIEVSPAMLERSRLLWGQLVPQHIHGPLPFVRVDANNPEEIASFWEVADGGDEWEDQCRGVFYAELLVHRAKTVRGNFDPFQMVQEVMLAIAMKGNPGAIERGFLARISMLALLASLN
jgi:hypothetical protein